MRRLIGKVAVVTGAAGGIGQATVRRLAAEGATVLATDVEPDRVVVAREGAGGVGPAVSAHRLDVTDEGEWNGLRDIAVARHGRIDVLVNNAGITDGAVIEDLTPDLWHRTLDVSLTGVFLGMRCFSELLKASGHGSVINISSVFADSGVGRSVAYSAAKAGVQAMTRTVAVRWATEHVRVNSISPGLVDTTFHGAARQAANARWSPEIPLGRFADADEIAAGVAFLASDDASYMTGADLRLDGGFLAR